MVLVPVNFMLNADEIAYILGHCEASGIVAEDALAPTAEKARELLAKLAMGTDGATPTPTES